MAIDTKMMEELILALTGWLNAKTSESKFEIKWMQKFIDDCSSEVKIEFDEDNRKFPDEFDEKER